MSVTVINPATEETIATLDEAGVEETDAAVAAAKGAFPAWRDVSPRDRGRLLRRLATLVEEHGEELARIESENVGKPIAGARGEVGMVADVFHFYAGAVDKKHGETIPVAGGIDMTFREPLGVVGLIVPWNFPLNIASWKLGPALACGNTVVLKPAELTPLSALRLAELALEAGIPAGVINVLVGKGRVVGQRLVEHPDVAKIGFTGSTEVGRGVMKGAADTIKRVTLELGGKSANVVFADADLEKAAASAPYAVFDNAGQDCCARSRILVEQSAYDGFAELFVAATKAVKVGDPSDESTEMGPLISQQHRETVASFVDGETLFTGETHPNAELLERAFAAFGRDALVVARSLADDIVWRVPGTNAMSGEYVGRDATLQFLRQTLVLTGGTYRTELQYVVADDDRAVAVYRACGEREGRTLDIEQALFCKVRDGQLADVTAVPFDVPAFEAFWE